MFVLRKFTSINLVNFVLEITDDDRNCRLVTLFGEALVLLHLQNGYYVLTPVFFNSSLNPMIYCWKMRHVGHTARALPMMKKDFTTHSYLRKLSRVSRR